MLKANKRAPTGTDEPKFTFIDLFAGCGGMSLGFEHSGFKQVLAIDNWQDALDTYKFNNPEASVLCGDLRQINPSEIQETYSKC